MSSPKYVDPLLLAVALAVFLLAGFPLLGYVAAAGAWIAQRGIQALASRRAAEALANGNRRSAMATIAGTTLGRVWLMAGVVLVAGLAEREVGLAAAVMTAALFTISLAAGGLAHLVEPEGQGAA